jgi:tRNA1Val (adenine37-N6)-methyltransferase
LRWKKIPEMTENFSRGNFEEFPGTNLKIFQDEKKFKFGIDAVLLSDFAATKNFSPQKICDLGTGTGIIPLLMSRKNPNAEFFALEIQEEFCAISRRNAEENFLSDRIKIVQGDIKNPPSVLEKNSFDVVTSNPPYIENFRGNKNADESMSICRHEILCTLSDVIRCAGKLLKSHGKFFLIHKPFRLPEIFSLMEKNHLAPKRMKLIFPAKEKNASMVLVEAEKNAKPYLTVEPPLEIYADKKFSESTKEIYARI